MYSEPGKYEIYFAGTYNGTISVIGAKSYNIKLKRDIMMIAPEDYLLK